AARGLGAVVRVSPLVLASPAGSSHLVLDRSSNQLRPLAMEIGMSVYWIAAIAAVVVLAVLSRRGERSDTPGPRTGSAPPSPERIDLFIRSGQKIEAIKEYRKLRHVDLKTAKDAVEARERELGR